MLNQGDHFTKVIDSPHNTTEALVLAANKATNMDK
jgi:hypothetical protein